MATYKFIEKAHAKFILLILLTASNCHAYEDLKCIPWAKFLTEITSHKSKFIFVVFSDGNDNDTFIRKNAGSVFVKNGSQILVGDVKQAAVRMELLAISFYFPLEDKECLKIGESIKKTINGFVHSLDRPHNKYITSTLKKNDLIISTAILEIDF